MMNIYFNPTYTTIKPTETPAHFMEGLEKTTRVVRDYDIDNRPFNRTETIYKDADGNVWRVETDRDGWLYKYMEL